MQDRPLRSLLFVPATKPSWLAKAIGAGADACVIDLEDSVSEANKADARTSARAMLDEAAQSGYPAFVRINGTQTDHWLSDLHSVVVEGLWGIALPKADTAADIAKLDGILSYIETERSLEPGSIDIQPLLETANGMLHASEVLAASPRVRSFFGGSARDGDINRELGFRWTPSGKETLYIRSKFILDARAAGVPFAIGGTWADVGDGVGLANFASENRDLGYTGMYVIHPSHVDAVNQAFTPSADEIARYERILVDMQAATERGDGATITDGILVDAAMASRARAYLSGLADAKVTTSSREESDVEHPR